MSLISSAVNPRGNLRSRAALISSDLWELFENWPNIFALPTKTFRHNVDAWIHEMSGGGIEMLNGRLLFI